MRWVIYIQFQIINQLYKQSPFESWFEKYLQIHIKNCMIFGQVLPSQNKRSAFLYIQDLVEESENRPKDMSYQHKKYTSLEDELW